MKVLLLLTALFIRIELGKVGAQEVIDQDGKLTGYSCVQATPINKKFTTKEQWLKSAQLVAFCLDKFGTHADGLNQSCATGSCKSCLKVCSMTTYINEVECWGQCSSTDKTACEAGCSFYLRIHGHNVSGAVNVSEGNAPNRVLAANIELSSYTYMDVAWSRIEWTSTVVYLVLSRYQYADDGTVGPFIPIGLTTANMSRITAASICRKFPGEYHHRIIQFAYKVIPVSKSGFKQQVITSLDFKAEGFKQVDFIDQVSVRPWKLKQTASSFLLDYQVSWSVHPALRPLVTRIQVSDHVSKNCSRISIDYSTTVDKNLNVSEQTVSLPDSRVRDCAFEFKVVPLTYCLHGVLKKKVIYYPGCEVFPDAPAECMPTKAPITLPPPSLIISKEVFQCTSYSSGSACNQSGIAACSLCADGVYNVTVKIDIRNEVGLNVTHISVWLHKASLFFRRVFYILDRQMTIDPSQSEVILTNLKINTNYSLKVFAQTPGVEPPLATKSPRLLFKTGGIPRPSTTVTVTTTTATTIAVDKTIFPSRTATVTPNSEKALLDSKKNSVLTVGLAVSLSVLAILTLLLLLFQMRRRLRKTRRMKLDSFEPVSYQANPTDSWELCLDDIVFGEALGEGAFGKVYVATVSGIRMHFSSFSCETLNSYVKMGASSSDLRNSSVTVKAAVKVLQDGFNEQQKKEFLDEIRLMKDVGQHKNIVNMLGCVTQGAPLCLVLEYMPHGDLLHFLRRSRTEIIDQNSSSNHLLSVPKYIHCDASQTKSTEYLMPPSPSSNQADLMNSSIEPNEGQRSEGENQRSNGEGGVSPEDLLRFSWQIASGMEYLTKKGFVHRDLAARNVLVGPNKSCKVSDFGLTRFVYEEKVYMGRKSRKLPLKWMSIEAIMDQCFTAYSDVWSFGVLLFEIVTLGGTPYPTMTGQELLRFLRAGNRMEKAENCSNEIYAIMKACWLADPHQRPTFTDIKERFEFLISEGTPYVEFDIDNRQPYYNVPSFISIGETTGDSLSDDTDEEEADWEYRFKSLNRRTETDAAANEMYTNSIEVDSHTLDGGVVQGEGSRNPVYSVSSEASTTPLADGVLHKKMESVDEKAFQGKRNAGPQAERSYQWETKESRKNDIAVPESPVWDDLQREPFVVGPYVNIDLTV